LKKIGFIGYGSMGSMLVNGFLSAKVLKQEDIVVSNRTFSKIEGLAQRWAGISLTSDNRKVVKECEGVFVCVKPFDVLPVLHEIKNELSEKTHLISITGCVSLDDIGSVFSGQATKIIPSITSEVKEGISLCCHNAKVTGENARRLEALMSSISRVILIKEEDFEVAADLTSCGPGLIAAIFDNFVKVGVRHSDLSLEKAQQMVVSTLLGTAKLLAEKGFGFSELIDRVATKGGITEEGVKVLNTQLPEIFDDVFRVTLSKHDQVKELIRNQIV